VLFFLVLGVVALYTSCVLGLRPFALSINSYFIKKKKDLASMKKWRSIQTLRPVITPASGTTSYIFARDSGIQEGF
jgi:hypothetical protein